MACDMRESILCFQMLWSLVSDLKIFFTALPSCSDMLNLHIYRKVRAAHTATPVTGVRYGGLLVPVMGNQ